MTTTKPRPPLSEADRFPESRGPGCDTESGTVLFGQPGHPRIGPIPHLLDPVIRDRENAERERQWDALPDAEKAAIEHMRELARNELRRGGGLF